MKKLINELCKGCYSSKLVDMGSPDLTKIMCAIRPVHKGVTCPCVTCLVKSMCQQGCEEYKAFGDLYHGWTYAA